MFNKLFKNILEKKKQRKTQKERCKPWFAVNGDETLRLNYNLSESSVVLDLGGFKGSFAESIYDKYSCEVYIFEPVKSFYEIIVEKFKNNEKVKPFHYGLSNEDKELSISNTGDASSVFIETEDSEKIELKSIVNFIKENNITNVDLIKINIEGGEYEVLESLLETGLISVFKNLQIQFHDFIIVNARERMENIQKKLAETHEITYQYDFVWENWKIKN
ncbi:MAG: FkbM family methyltransferase [Polaribacter sp.]